MNDQSFGRIPATDNSLAICCIPLPGEIENSCGTAGKFCVGVVSKEYIWAVNSKLAIRIGRMINPRNLLKRREVDIVTYKRHSVLSRLFLRITNDV